MFFFFFFNDTATTEIYTLSLHDALPIYVRVAVVDRAAGHQRLRRRVPRAGGRLPDAPRRRGHSGHRCDRGCGLPAVGLAARDLQPARQTREREAARPHAARAGSVAAARRLHRVDRRVSEADPRPDGAHSAPVHRERPAAGAHCHRARAMILDLSSSRDLLLALLPELVLTGWSLVLLLVVAWRHRTAGDLRLTGWVTLAALASTAAAVWWLWWHTARAAPGPVPVMVAVDDFRFVTDWLFLGAAALTVLLSFDYLEREELLVPEYYVLIVFATLGMMLMGGGEDLMVIFLGLELLSVAVYVLAGINRKSASGAEAAFKYFLLGAFASGFLLYGIALVYGATGTTGLRAIGAEVGAGGGTMLLIGLALLLIGFGFKIAAVPFHMWVPDVYDGSPTPVAAYMASGVKAAAFAALFRVLGEAFPAVAAWHQIVWWLAVATM